MSDLWPFSSSCPPPIIHPFPSPSLTTNHRNSPHAKVPLNHFMPQTQVSSPHLPEHQVTSPHHLQMTSLHLSHPQEVTSPHIVPETQVISPQLLYQTQVTSPHCVPWSQASSPHLLPQAQVTSPYLVPQSQVTSPHLLSLPQYHLSNHNHDPGLDDPNWSRAEAPSDLCHQPKSSCQNQTTAHLDLHLQNQNQFCTGVTHPRDELENTHTPAYNTHTLLASGVYEQGEALGAVQDTWGPPGPSLSQLQCSPLGSMSGEVALGRWSSLDFSSAPAEDSSNNQFFHDSYHDNNALQPFCSPNTPGPSPHYPQTPTYSSPGPQIYPREERLDFHSQTSRQVSRDQTLSCCLQEYDSYAVTSDPGQHHQHLLQTQSEPIQDQTGLLDTTGNSESCFSPQGGDQALSSAGQSAGGGGGRGGGGGGGRGGGGGGNGQPDWTWMKRPQLKHNTEVLDSRLSCVVCKRDFRSLPALNGHMRSHSGSRSATLSNKAEGSTPSAPSSISMVMPVTVPVQSRGVAKVHRGGQRRCSLLSPASGHTVLYRSFLHLEEEETVAKGDGANSSRGDDEQSALSGDGVVAGGDSVIGGHYTPPPMLCPLRVGPGLYCSLTTRRQQRVQTVQLHNTHNDLNDLVATETTSPPPGTLTSGINKPRINVGRSFQAEIPPLQGRKCTHSNSHSALLLWTPWDELEHPVNQQRVEALLMMARSSVVPGGGASPDSALHVLSECRGDFLLTVEKLLSTPETSNNNNNNHAAQQLTSVSWSEAERRSLVKSLQLHHKDFSTIQKAVQTKSVSQCVEFYYLWKKKLSLSLRTPAGLTVTLPDRNGQRSPKIT